MAREAADVELTAVELLLIDHVRRGRVLDLMHGRPVDHDAMDSWGAEQSVRASVLRDILRGRYVTEPDPHGLRLRGAKVVGRVDLAEVRSAVLLSLRECDLRRGITLDNAHIATLDLRGCRIRSTDRSAIAASSLRAEAVKLEDVVATGAGEWGAVCLLDAHITGRLDAVRATLTNTTGPALYADGLQVDASLFLRKANATGSGALGAVRLLGAHVGGQLEAGGATLVNATGPALHADTLQVDANLHLAKANATGSGELGAVRLLGAHVGGQLDADGATLVNATGPALQADGLQVDASLFLHSANATGSGEHGTVRLLGAHVGGQLDAGGATLVNATGPALHADLLQVDANLRLAEANVTGSGELGAVRLLGAHIGGELDATGATLTNEAGPALHADLLQVGTDLRLAEATATGSGEAGAVRLSGAHVGGLLDVDPDRIYGPRTRRRPTLGNLDVDGLVYGDGPTCGVERWLHTLREQTLVYAGQPYRQLAGATQALGHDGQARTVLIAQRHDQLRRGETSRWERIWGRFTLITLGYGYRPWLALCWLLGVLGVAIALTLSLGTTGLAHTARSTAPGEPCTTLEQVAVAIDLSVPLIKPSGAQDVCAPTDTSQGTALTIGAWAIQLAAWSLATLFIAGFTSAVRKT